jgi:hypothetical protein
MPIEVEMEHRLSSPGGLVEGEKGSAPKGAMRKDECGIGVANIEGCADGRIRGVGLAEAWVAVGNGPVLGETALWDPAPGPDVVRESEVQCGTIGAGLTAANDLLEQDRIAMRACVAHRFLLPVPADDQAMSIDCIPLRAIVDLRPETRRCSERFAADDLSDLRFRSRPGITPFALHAPPVAPREMDRLELETVRIREEDGVIVLPVLGILRRRIEDGGPTIDEDVMERINVGALPQLEGDVM